MRDKYLIFRSIVTYPKTEIPFEERYRKFIQNMKNNFDDTDNNLSNNTLHNLVHSKSCNLSIIGQSQKKANDVEKKGKVENIKKSKKSKKRKKVVNGKVKAKVNKAKANAKAKVKVKVKAKAKGKKTMNTIRKGKKQSSKKRGGSTIRKQGGKRKRKLHGGFRRTCKIKRRISRNKTLKRRRYPNKK